MKYLKPILLWLAETLLTLLGLGLWSFPPTRFLGYTLLGIAFLTVLYLLLKRLSRKKPRAAKILRTLLTVCLCLFLTAALVTEGFVLYAASGQQSGDAPYLIVLGCGVNGTVPSLSLSDRLTAAAAYLQDHPDTVCVVSGGQGPGEEITEAECMYRWLIAQGIHSSRILKEEKSTSTRENLAFSKEVIRAYSGEEPREAAILSSEYHLFRAGQMALDQGLEPMLVPAQTSWISIKINYLIREVPAIWYYWIFGG